MTSRLPRTLLTSLAATAALAAPTAASAATSQSFTTPGATQFTVPAGVTRISIDAIGGQGGGALQTPPFRCQGGPGSRVRGTLTVTPGQRFWVVVGGAGGDAMPPIASSAGGSNGGGDGRSIFNGVTQWGSGGGGGATDIRTLPVANGLTPTDSRLLVAGGGGGAGGDNRDACPAGGVGGATPGAGHEGAFGTTGGQPGTPSAGGARGLSATCSAIDPSTDGALGVGGRGAFETQSNGLCSGSGAGGGGGRYGGGGGGASQQSLFYGGGGGGAGSNYTNASIGGVAITTAPWERVNAPLNGSVTIDWAPDAPTAAISAPATGGTYAVGQTVATSFTCTDSPDGGGITACVDDAGRTSPATLDTTTTGAHTYTVTATSASGLSGTASISYTVAGAPSATISAPASGGTYAVGQNVATSFSCAEGASGPGIRSCLDEAGEASPGRLDTSTTGTHSYTVTATSLDGQTRTASISYTVAGAPSATISAPASGGTYAVGENVATSFTCAEGASGPGIRSCLDDAGAASPGRLDTSTTGVHSYTVTAISRDGQTRTTSITYTVAGAPSATIASPASGGVYAVDQAVATTFTCAEGASGPGIRSCLDDAGASSPGRLDTSTTGVHSYTVTATSRSGQTSTASITYTVAGGPSATISAPVSGGIYAVDQAVATSFTCAEGASGPGIRSCLDDDAASSPGRLDTSTTGTHTYTVTATSGSGQTSTASITYTVAAAPSATIAAPATGGHYAVGQDVATSFTCAEGTSGPGIRSCRDDAGATSPGRLDTSTTGTHTYTVTATSGDGQTSTDSITYSVARTPTATISAPADGATFAVGEPVTTSFTCAAGENGGAVTTCEDGAGASSPGRLDTSRAGRFTYTVDVASDDGLSGSTTIAYTVVSAVDPPARREPETPSRPSTPGGSGGGDTPSNRVSFTRVRTNADGSLRFTVRFPGRGRAETMLTARRFRLAGAAATFSPLASRFAFATGRVTVERAGLLTITLRPNRRGRELIARGRGATSLRLWVAFTPTGGRQRKISVFGVRVPPPPAARG